jgi:hypothetical protein
MDIGPEIERITVEPLEDPVPREEPTPAETPERELEPVPAGNLPTHHPAADEQVRTISARA